MTGKNSNLKSRFKDFFQAAFSVDIVLFTFIEGRLKIMVIEKDGLYDSGGLGLPGKIIAPEEDVETSLNQFMDGLIGTNRFRKKQLRALTDPARHPLGRIITIAYYGLISIDRINPKQGQKIHWYDLDEIPKLAYDHNSIVNIALNRFRKGLLRHPNVFELLPETFILSEVVNIYEQAFDRKIDGPNLRKQLRESGLLVPVGEERKAVKQMGRPPQLYRFDKKKFKGQRREMIGFNF